MRVQIPAYTDRWMMGDRFGTVVKITNTKTSNTRAALLSRARNSPLAHVKLDKSQKIVRVILDDCTPVADPMRDLADTLTDEEIRKLIEKRPQVYGRFARK